MKVLFASRYVDPVHPAASQVFNSQARILQNNFGVNLEILTWPHNDHWVGALPTQKPTIEPLRLERNGLSYAVISCPDSWNELAGGNCISDSSWRAAVDYGVRLLEVLKPDIFHLHHRYGFWWLLESAQRLNIPTVYSNYDWGIACLRTVLVKGSGELCDGTVTPAKCAACIKSGRSGFFGKLNESLVEVQWINKVLQFLDESSFSKDWFHRIGALSRPTIERVTTHQKRLSKVINALDYCITPSDFGKNFFHQLGLPQKKCSVIPWFHDQIVIRPMRDKKSELFTITYVGRVSPEKGVHLIFEALELLDDIPQVLLRVVGVTKSKYCDELRGKYKNTVGRHKVEWRTWVSDSSEMVNLLRTTDVNIIPSNCVDNTPMALIEAMAYRVPVIATNIPTIAGLLDGTRAGYLAEFNSIQSLSNAIKSATLDKELIRSGKVDFPKILTAREYGSKLYEIYSRL